VHSPQVLVVDDEPSIRLMFAAALGGYGFEVVTAGRVAEGMAVLHRQAVDAVILDVRMPGASGLQLLEYIRFNPEWRHLPVLIVTGSTLSEQEEVTVATLGAYVFYKPESHLLIVEHLTRLVSARGTAEQLSA
jgi:CheY-like chemotaxis protein